VLPLAPLAQQQPAIDPAALPLRDIHLPDPVSWWPPAPGWWIVAALLMVGAGLAAIVAWRRRTRVQRRALAMLDGLQRRYRGDGDAAALARGLSTLLRRLALECAPRREVAGLTGNRWLEWLDRGLPGEPFSRGIGRLLTDAPYRPSPALAPGDVNELIELSRQRIESLRPSEGPR
jgi:hypothetical protein